MTNATDGKPGDRTVMYCSDCEEERIFVWAVWSGVEFFGYPPGQEYGWECTACGNKLRVP